MKRALLCLCLTACLAGGFASTAGATIVAGSTVDLDGWLVLQRPAIGVRCSLSLDATVTSTTTLSVTSGTASPCQSPYAYILSGFPWTITITLGGDWAMTGVGLRATVPTAPPFFADCSYTGTLYGTYASTPSPLETQLTFTTDNLWPVRGSSAICPAGGGARGVLTGPGLQIL